MTALTLFLLGVSPGFGAAGIVPSSSGAGKGSARIAATRPGTPWPASSSTWSSALGDRSEDGDTMRRLPCGKRDHAILDHGRRATTGLFAVIDQVTAVRHFVRSRVNHVLNPNAFGFRVHFDVAASLRRPGNGFVITLKF